MPDERTEAEKLNTNEPGNPSGKPIQPGTDLDADNREQLHPDDHDAVWADAATVEP